MTDGILDISSKLKVMIVEKLSLKINPDQIDGDQPLFAAVNGHGLGLDSLEALEVVLGIEELFGVRIDYFEGVEERFYSINTMAEYIRELLEKDA